MRRRSYPVSSVGGGANETEMDRESRRGWMRRAREARMAHGRQVANATLALVAQTLCCKAWQKKKKVALREARREVFLPVWCLSKKRDSRFEGHS